MSTPCVTSVPIIFVVRRKGTINAEPQRAVGWAEAASELSASETGGGGACELEGTRGVGIRWLL